MPTLSTEKYGASTKNNLHHSTKSSLTKVTYVKIRSASLRRAKYMLSVDNNKTG